ncbi:MAG: hypothetical protein KKE11_05530 [Gammaproteobacteria bacterium]|nr:hypothetical protein [Gammaproteobacteria bacterium]
MVATSTIAAGAASLAGGTYIAQRYNTGAKAYRAFHSLEKYRDATTGFISAQLRKQFKDMKASREKSNNKVIFNFTKVSILDHKAAEKIAKIKIQSLVEAKLTGKNPLNPEIKLESTQFYNVKLIIDKKDITLGEIDYSDWNRLDFHVTITRDNDPTPLLKTSSEYKKVLATLKNSVKVSGNKQLKPTDIAADKIDAASFWDWGWGTEKINTQTIDLSGGLNPRLVEDDYIIDTQILALKKAKQENYEILDNYFDILEQARRNELADSLILLKTLQAENLAYDLKNSKRKYLLFAAGLLIGAVIVIAAIVALNVFLPGIGTAITSVGITSISAGATVLASKMLDIFSGYGYGLSGLLGITAVSIGITSWKIKGEWNAEKMLILKEDIAKCRAKAKMLHKDIKDIRGMKKSSNKTLKAIVNLSDNAKSLDLSETHTHKNIFFSAADGLISRFNKLFRNSTNNKIGNVGVDIICNYLSTIETHIDCENLNLANNDITETGAKLLANMLTTAQSRSDKFNIKTIDLSGNPIGESGVSALQNALLNNFSITTIKYDNKKIDREIVDVIDRQLLINRHIQNEPLGMSLERISALFPQENSIDKQAVEKIETNFNTTNFPPKLNPNISGLVTKNSEQNKIFLLLFTNKPTADNYKKAFNINPERCDDFITNNQSIDLRKTQKQIELIRKSISEKLSTLSDIDPEQLEMALQILFTPCNDDTKENITLFVKIIKNLPKDEDPKTPVMLSILKNQFALLNTQDHDTFKNSLKKERTKIAKNPNIKDTERKALLETIDSSIHSNLTTIEQQKIKLKKLANGEHTSNVKEAFKDFIDTYKTIPEDQAAQVFSNNKIIKEKFVELVKSDVYDQKSKKTLYTNLRRPDLSEQHRLALLEFCFSSDDGVDFDNKNKAILLTDILTDQKTSALLLDSPAMANFREKYLPYAFSWSKYLFPLKAYAYKDLESAIETLRNSALTNDDYTTAEILDKPLQAVFQTNLVTKFPGLHDPSKPINPDELKPALEENYQLRNLNKFSTNIDPKARDLVNIFILRNKLLETVSDVYVGPTKKLEKFLEIYSEIKTEKERTESLKAFIKIDGNNEILLEMLKNDTYRNNSLALRGIDELQRIELLAASLGNDKNSMGIATAASKLIEINPPISSKYIWSIFNWERNLTSPFSHKKWDFRQYIDELKKLRGSNPNIAAEINHAIQSGLQVDIIDRLNRSEPIELEDNYDLMEFDLGKSNANVSAEVKGQIEFICQRNILNKYAESSDLENFIKTYAKTPGDKCGKFLLTLYKPTLLKLIDKDLGPTPEKLSCEKLRSLGNKHLLALLEHCFLINDDEHSAHEKALSITKLLKSDPEVLNGTGKINQKLKHQIYWAISPGRTNHPYYNNNHLLNELHKISKLIPANDKSLVLVREAISDAFLNIDFELEETKPTQKLGTQEQGIKQAGKIPERKPASLNELFSQLRKPQEHTDDTPHEKPQIKKAKPPFLLAK